MDTLLTTSLQSWQTFYILLGTAAATLLGLLFVALSVGSGDIYEQRTSVVFTIFVHPVYHQFLSVLIIALLLIIPVQTAISLTVCLFVLGLYNALDHVGTLRSAIARRHILDSRARVSNVILPIFCTIAIFVAAILFTFSIQAALLLLAAASFFSLVLGTANTWQIMTWIKEQQNKPFDEKKN